MKNVKIVLFLLLTLMAGSIFSQELTKEEKRARKKAARTILKEANKLINAGEYDAAMVMTDSLIILDSSNPDAFYNKGLILLKTGDSTSAMAKLEEATTIAPLSTKIRILLARIKLGVSDADGAAIQLDEVLRVKPNQSEALYLRGLVHLEKNETAQAVELFKKALELTLEKGN